MIVTQQYLIVVINKDNDTAVNKFVNSIDVQSITGFTIG